MRGKQVVLLRALLADPRWAQAPGAEWAEQPAWWTELALAYAEAREAGEQ